MSNTSVGGIVLMLVVGLVMIGGGGYMWYEQSQRIDSYESTEGTVLSSDVYDDHDGGDYIDITYEYIVDGETYRSSNVRPGFGETSVSRSRAEEFVQNHSEGEPITVYYDPVTPSNAYLIAEKSLAFIGMAGFGAVITIAALWVLVRRLSGDNTQ